MSYQYPVAPPRRPVWPWVLGGVGVVLLLLVVGGGILAAIAIPIFLAQQGNAQVSVAVMDFDTAIKELDCERFDELTDESAKSYFIEGEFTCDAFDEAFASYLDPDFAYTVTINDVDARGDVATATTTESWQFEGSSGSLTGVYELERHGDEWIITEFEEFGAPE